LIKLPLRHAPDLFRTDTSGLLGSIPIKNILSPLVKKRFNQSAFPPGTITVIFAL